MKIGKFYTAHYGRDTKGYVYVQSIFKNGNVKVLLVVVEDGGTFTRKAAQESIYKGEIKTYRAIAYSDLPPKVLKQFEKRGVWGGSNRNPSSSRKPTRYVHYNGCDLIVAGNIVSVYDGDGYRYRDIGSDGAFAGEKALQRAKAAIDRKEAAHDAAFYKHHPGLGVKVKRNTRRTRRNGMSAGAKHMLAQFEWAMPVRFGPHKGRKVLKIGQHGTHIPELIKLGKVEMLGPKKYALVKSRSNGARRNGKKPTYKAARLATWKAFGAAGWDLSSPHLNVLHATSPWGDVRLWFKAQAILVGHGGSPWRMGDARTLAYDLDLRTVTDYPAFVRAVGKRLGFK